MGSAKAIEQMTKTPPALTSDVSGGSCLPCWGQRTGFLQKEVVFELGLKGPMAWLQVANSMLGMVGTKVDERSGILGSH